MSDESVVTATAFAPACVGNVAVGFDLLGHPVDGPGDTVTVTRTEQTSIDISRITGLVTDLPTESTANTATAALHAMRDGLGLQGGYSVEIDKGIALASGMAGSAASAVAAVVAANALLEKPLAIESLLPFALEGEKVATGVTAIDNVGPQLLGGLRLGHPDGDKPIRLPVPDGLRCVLIHPDCQVVSIAARDVLPGQVSLGDSIGQAGRLATFVASCYLSDLDLLSSSMRDLLIEPHRSGFVPGFCAVKSAALREGALGCSLSGSGPSMFAWCRDEDAASVEQAMCESFESAGLTYQAWISDIDAAGARLVGSSGTAKQ